ncbi:MAG: hypothetical protein ACI4TH_06310, partial [Candidatus Ornithomonoglobus sp.]
MKHTKLFSKLIAAAEALILLAACLAGCGGKTDDPTPPQDNEKEYFTEGSKVSRYAFPRNTVQINDHLYYYEDYTYTENVSVGSLKRKAERIVRLSLKTGNVSSACVDPVCTHTYASHCPLNIDYSYEKGKTLLELSAVGDWLFYIISEPYKSDDPNINPSDIAQKIMTYMVYNTVTGESRELFPHSSVGESGATPAIMNAKSYGDLIFVLVPEFVKDENGNESLVYSLMRHDVKKDETKTIYTSSNSFGIPAVTNKRVYISSTIDGVSKKISFDWDGQNIREEQDIFVANVAYGTREYYTDGEFQNICVYNLETRKSKKLDISALCGGYCISNDILYYSTLSNLDEYLNIDSTIIFEDYSGPDPQENFRAYLRDVYAVQYGGKAQLYAADLDGGSPKLLFEYEHMIIQCVAAAGNYLYAYITSAQPPEYTIEKTANNGFSRIDLTTG